MSNWSKMNKAFLAFTTVLLFSGCGNIAGNSGANVGATPQASVEAGAAAATPAPVEKKTVKIGYLPITHALPLYVEQDLYKDQFDNIEIELVKFGAWPELMDALTTGRIDGASVLVQLAMAAKEKGAALSAVALAHRDGNVVVTSDEVQTDADLEGKTFAIPHRLSTHNVLLYQTLKNAGLSFSDVKVVELPPPEMPAALAEKRIAGYVVAEPFGALSVVQGSGHVYRYSKDLWKNSVCCAFVLRDDFINNHPAAAKELVQKYVGAGSYIAGDGEQVREISQKYMSVKDDVLNLASQWISYEDLKIYEEDYKELSQYLVEMKLSENPPAYQDFVNTTLFDDAVKQ